MTAKLNPGDRIAYAANFLKNTAQHTGDAPHRRGTYIGPCASLGAPFVHVRWDDIDYATHTGADPELAALERQHGHTVHSAAIARVGSARFSVN